MSQLESPVFVPRLATEGKPWPTHELEWVGRCPLCASIQRSVLYAGLTDRVFFCAPGVWTLYRCHGCEAAYLDPRPTPESIGRAYDAYYTHAAGRAAPGHMLARLKRALRDGYLNARYRFDLKPSLAWAQWILPLFPPLQCRVDRMVRHLPLEHQGTRLLDVGCGNGAFVKEACRWGWNAEGLDPDPQAVAVGREAGLQITAGTLPRTGYADSSFAAVTMSHSIEHLHDPIASLREVCRILKPGGAVWIATPNLSSSGHKLFGRHWRGLEPPRHLVLFTPGVLAQALTCVGFGHFRQVRTPFVSQEMFKASYRIAQGEDPCAKQGQPPPILLRCRAGLADWEAFFQAQRGDEMVFVGRKP